jgi:uncharacterized radical SAM superfamily protein
MSFVCVPKRTLAVSVTGESCSLQCNHCRARYLRHMVPVSSAQRVLESGEYASILLSGGSDCRGRIPLAESLTFIAWVKQRGIRINAHVGFQDPEDIVLLAPMFDKVSLDYIWDDETIREVYHMERTGEEYRQAAQLWLAEMLVGDPTGGVDGAKRRLSLHLTIGLKGGVVTGEREAIDSLIPVAPASLVFLILIPTEGTPYEHVPLVPLDDIESVIAYARHRLPATDLVLGCMRPRVKGYGEELTRIAHRYDFRCIVGERGERTIEELEECCVFYH